MSLTSPDLMKLNNKRTILELIYREHNIYRAQIAEMTNMSNQTITNLVKELLVENKVKEVTLEKKSKGRNPMALSINSKYLLTIGLEISVHGITGSVYNLDNELLVSESAEINHNNLERIKDILNKLTHDLDKECVLGIGISIEGVVDEVTGLVIKSKDIGLDGINIFSELAYLDMPILIRNDVNMLAETDSKKLKDENYILIKIDRGIGASLVMNGKILHHENSAAGELGHMTVYGLENPKQCKCGKKGCLTTVASEAALESALKMNLDEIKNAITEDDNVKEYLEQSVEYISRPLSNLITFLDLESVLLTGSVIKTFGTSLENTLLKRINEKLTSWVSFKGLKIIDDYEMTERCSKCVVENYFINWK